MLINHYPPFPLGASIPGSKRGSQVYLAKDPNRRLIIFVHGFWGSAVGTWDGFPEVIRSSQMFMGRDIIFHGYEWNKKQVAVLGNQLHDLVDYLADDHRRIAPQRPATRNWPDGTNSYEQITIISHSLGSLVSRYAVLTAHKRGSSWRTRASMIMFAPAHNGNRVLPAAGVVAGAMSPITSIIFHGSAYFIPTMDDLGPESQIITSIRADTQTQYQGGNTSVAARAVLWADGERVVYNVPYPNDPSEIVVPQTHHTNVCKPTRQRQLPVTALKGLI